MKKLLVVFAVVFVVAIAVLTSDRANALDAVPFQVTATVVASCDITADPLVFGNYDPLDAVDNDETTSIYVTCSNGAPWQLSLDIGIGSGASFAVRKMTHTDTVSLLNYSLYTEGGYGTVWQDAAPNWVTGVGTGLSQTQTVHGRIPALQTTAPTGDYADTITATVTY